MFGALALVFALYAAPLPAVVGQNLSDSTGQKGPVKVWVNTPSRVYHCPGSRWYGGTKKGEYMNESDAKAKGNRPAYGKPCS